MKTNKTNRISSSAFALVALSAYPLAQAAIVTWSAPVTITTEEVIQANVSSAFNLTTVAGTSVVTTTTQTVTFVNGAGPSRTSNGITLVLDVVPDAQSGFVNAGIPPNAAPLIWEGPNTDPDFEGIMDSFAHSTTTAPFTGAFQLTGLTNGQAYSVQLLAADMRVGIGDFRTISFNDGVGNSTATVLQNTAPSFIGTFTATGTTQSFNSLSNVANGSVVLNAVTLSLIPEPSAALLGGIGMLFLLRRRR